ncbi:bifunctional adenosylcobinamide kinase/adenosylcobinamide-phosphate guanylyltransferase [Sneathiella glossodoripedis]|uniref:bifunctional adenosylcobinamide kinase/adenosylcobinamide-phosphate guanylyltransferase n=1 Tax=Sneathiella glossodoripedis TaxID=418853 RepID=UPI0004715190|nr:bifunctional adenosylcobinamide kinase/adenosylcobinamide-phosphate guanylyltransferase [Sneathiella glossodoripedis]
MNTSKITFVLGGARSGKSRFAEQLAIDSGLNKIYVATSQIFDAEMQERVNLHQQSRGGDWITIEEPIDLGKILKTQTGSGNILLIDCLTLWLTNLVLAERNIEDAGNSICDALQQANGPVILVSNEVGLGIVPENEMARRFRDHAGILHQKIAALADRVYLITAGLPQQLK